MPRRRKGRALNGVVLIDKPQGASSNDVLQKVRWLYQAAKAGHTGALDPLATGMLPVCFGEATKLSQLMLDADKTYQVVAKLGERTDTSDADGEIIETQPVDCSEPQIRQAALSFLGKSEQQPSIYSALKYQGKPLYWYARQGIEVPRPIRPIEVYELNVDDIDGDLLTMTLRVSKGTYIRTIVDDLGQQLGCGAHVQALRRLAVSGFDDLPMFTIEQLESQRTEPQDLDTLLLPMTHLVAHLPQVTVPAPLCERVRHGNAVDVGPLPDGELLQFILADNQQFAGLAKPNSDGLLQPCRLINYN